MANTSVDVKKPSAPAPVPHNGDIFQSMRHEMERLFDRFSHFDLAPFGHDIERFWPHGNGNGMLSVSVDVAEDDKAYTITAELPGIEEKDIDVSIANDVLTLKGEKRAEKEEKSKSRYVSERPSCRCRHEQDRCKIRQWRSDDGSSEESQGTTRSQENQSEGGLNGAFTCGRQGNWPWGGSPAGLARAIR